MLELPSDQGPITSSYDDQHEIVYAATFDLVEFFGPSSEVGSIGWSFVHQLRSDLPDARPWSHYRVYEGKLTITSRRRSDVEANMRQLAVLANLKAVGLDFAAEPTADLP